MIPLPPEAPLSPHLLLVLADAPMGSQLTPILPRGGHPPELSSPQPPQMIHIHSPPCLNFSLSLCSPWETPTPSAEPSPNAPYSIQLVLPSQMEPSVPFPWVRGDPSILTFPQGLPIPGVLTVAHPATPSSPSPPAGVSFLRSRPELALGDSGTAQFSGSVFGQ